MRYASLGAVVVLLSTLAHAPSPADPKKVERHVLRRWPERHEPFLPNPFLAEIIAKEQQGRALDVAMGRGRNDLMLAERAWAMTGFDISDVAIAQGHRAAAMGRTSSGCKVRKWLRCP